MLTILGKQSRYCDGVSRRGFLRIGALGVGAGALTLADLFRIEAHAGVKPGTRHKSVINVFLGGGPPHQDMWEIKTEAPADIRGEFKPISTKVAGIQIGEVFPRIAARMDKCVVIRSLVGASGGHDAVMCMSGWHAQLPEAHGRPAAASAPPSPRCRARSIPPCRRSSAWPSAPQHVPWSDPGHAWLPRHRPRRRSSPTATAWATCVSRAPASRRSATASDCSPASTACAATSTPAAASRPSTP